MTGFLLALFFSIVIGLFGKKMAKERMPAGSFVAMLAGLLGAWVGGYSPVFSSFGPSIDSLAIIPSIFGAVIFVFFLRISKNIVKQAK